MSKKYLLYGYDYQYCVDENGETWNLETNKRLKSYDKEKNNKRRKIELVKNGKPKKEYISRLVATTIDGGCFAKFFDTHHIDGDNRNDKRSNILNVTQREHILLHIFMKKDQIEYFHMINKIKERNKNLFLIPIGEDLEILTSSKKDIMLITNLYKDVLKGKDLRDAFNCYLPFASDTIKNYAKANRWRFLVVSKEGLMCIENKIQIPINEKIAEWEGQRGDLLYSTKSKDNKRAKNTIRR